MPTPAIRTAWAGKLGEPSDLLVELQVEATQPGSIDSPCVVRGRIAVPDPPRTDEETNFLAHALVCETVLPSLGLHWTCRVLEMAINRQRTLERTLEVRGLSMPRFMWWEKEYLENPYMRALPMKDLNRRLFDLMTNSQNITTAGKIGVRTTAGGVEWMRYLQHVTTEALMRELPYPLFLDNRYTSDWATDAFFSSVKGDHSARADTAVQQWREVRYCDFDLVKYGEYEFMKRFIDSGELQVCPSRSFDNEHYHQALRDDENSVTAFGARAPDGAVVPAHDLPSWWGDRYSMLEFTASTDRDYFLYCTSRTLSPTLFSHFGRAYDSCVLIHDMAAFTRRLHEAAKESLPPHEFVFAGGPVTYVDPLGAVPPKPVVPEGSDVPIVFLKHFRHAYQDEMRYVWVPKEPARGLEKTVISIGPITDIAELLRV